MKRRTKIVCTLGPSVDSKESIQALIEAGMNVARLNCSHGDWETKRNWIRWIRELSPDLAPVAILADLQGPKFRCGDIQGGELDLKAGQIVSLGSSAEAEIPVHQPEILKVMGPNCRILMGDGEIELKVINGTTERFTARVVTGGQLRSRKGMTLVGKVFDVPALTPKDYEDAESALDAGVDIIALSYVKSATDVRELRRVIEKKNPGIQICAKIETREALHNLDEIIKVVDVVMVARGDMGLQMELEDVPLAQKRIIHLCSWAGKPVITATQMLESMIHNSRPTRAETTDVFNAILDGTDAVMLSGETAAGMYPVECVKTMARIAQRAETQFDRTRIEHEFDRRKVSQIHHTDAIAHAVSDLEKVMRPEAILTTTTSGQTARLVSKYRPKAPILCATWNELTQNQMAVVWGVEALRMEKPENTDAIVQHSIDAFMRKSRLKIGDLVIITAGVPAGVAGNTNLILTETVR
ncbi:MAG: pyruvate kinase [Fimbriimonas sp.]